MWCHNLLLLVFFCSNNQAELVSNYQEFFRFSHVSYCVYLFFIFIILLMGHRTSNPQPTDYQTINSNSNNNNNNDNNRNLIKEIAREIMGFIIVNWIFHFLKSHICKLRLIFFSCGLCPSLRVNTKTDTFRGERKPFCRIQTFCRQIDWQSTMSDLSAKNNYRLPMLF